MAVNAAAAGWCTDADSIVVVSGVTVTPSSLAVSRYGLLSDGDVRRASTWNSQTPGTGSSYERAPALQAVAAGSSWWV